MSDFPTALYNALSAWYPVAGIGIRRPVTHRQGFTARVNALERAHGGRRGAAAAAGVSYNTWRQWFGKGARNPSAASLAKLDRAYALEVRGKVHSKTTGPSLMVVTAVVVADPKKTRYTNKKKRRDFRADQLGRDELEPVTAAYRHGESAGYIAQVAITAIRQEYGTEFAFEGDDVRVELS